MEMISENNFQMGMQQLKADQQAAIMKYQTQRDNVNYFEKTALPNATLITRTANQQFADGEINYLEWVILINSAVAIRSNYADAVNELNQTIIQLNFLNTK